MLTATSLGVSGYIAGGGGGGTNDIAGTGGAAGSGGATGRACISPNFSEVNESGQVLQIRVRGSGGGAGGAPALGTNR
jgi:hypothetical protein